MTTMTPPTGRDRKPAAPRLTADNWRTAAACKKEDPDLFFPIGLSGPALDQEEAAKAVCGQCPALDWCREWSLETGQSFGVWGGLSQWDRNALLGRRAPEHRTSSDGTPAWQVIVETRRSEYEGLAAEGLGDWAIGQRMRTNSQTIRRVREALQGLEQVEGVSV